MAKASPEVRFRRLYEGYHQEVLSYFLRRTDRDAAYDATEDVFVIAWRRLDSIPEGGPELAWLYSVSKGVLANHRRKAMRFGRLLRRLSGQRPATSSGPELQVIESEDHRAVVAALASLSEGDQEVLRLAVWEELPHADIGQILGCSRGAVDVRVHRATRRLVKAFNRAVLKPSEKSVSLFGDER